MFGFRWVSDDISCDESVMKIFSIYLLRIISLISLTSAYPLQFIFAMKCLFGNSNFSKRLLIFSYSCISISLHWSLAKAFLSSRYSLNPAFSCPQNFSQLFCVSKYLLFELSSPSSHEPPRPYSSGTSTFVPFLTSIAYSHMIWLGHRSKRVQIYFVDHAKAGSHKLQKIRKRWRSSILEKFPYSQGSNS